MDYEYLLPFCDTEVQENTIKALISEGSQRKAAKKLGINFRNVAITLKRIRGKAARQGVSPKHDMTREVPDGFHLKGTSTLYDKSGNQALQWVKTNIDHERQLELIEEAVSSISSEIIPSPQIKYEGGKATDKQFSVFPIGDPHIGLRCWSKEVGEDWDVAIAKRVFKNVFERIVSMMPVTEEAILVNTGDLFHADNIRGETSRSGHKLDLDGRHGYWIDAAIAIVRMWVETLLRRYKKVTYINVVGNHDDILGRFMGGMVENFYQDNKRLEVQKGDCVMQYAHREKVLLGFAHGHTAKLNALVGKMADDVPQLWGNSTYRHIITGHVHHNSFQQYKEHPGCSVETVGIIPPRDAYAYGGGYGARRGTQGIIFDKEYGEMVLRMETRVRGSD